MFNYYKRIGEWLQKKSMFDSDKVKAFQPLILINFTLLLLRVLIYNLLMWERINVQYNVFIGNFWNTISFAVKYDSQEENSIFKIN